MATVTAKTTLIAKIEALVSKSAEDHRILSVHYSKIATRLRLQSIKPEDVSGDDWDALAEDEDEVTNPEMYAEYIRCAELAYSHRQTYLRKASAIRADRRDSGFSRRDFEVAC